MIIKINQKALLIENNNIQALLLRAIALGKLKAISESAVTYREATRINQYFYEAYKGWIYDILFYLTEKKKNINFLSI